MSWSPPVYYAPSGFPLFYQIAVVNEERGFIHHLNLSNVTLIEIANVTECDTFNVSITASIDHYTSTTTTESNNGSTYKLFSVYGCTIVCGRLLY